MQKTSVRNLLTQISRPNRAFVMCRKLWKRVADDTGLLSRRQNLEWINHHCSTFEQLANDIAPVIWKEAEKVSTEIERNAEDILKNIDYDLGGGGAYPFLYFVTRYMRPTTIVETGVACGFSSSAFLRALDENKAGVLYSSDFPYFRLPNPERFIGVIVDEHLKNNWHLYIEGDEVNLPKILRGINEIDIFHYDSDKSYSGRRFAMELVKGKMSKMGLILMDDIEDNSFFHDYVTSNNVSNWSVFKFEGKYVGMIGSPSRRESIE